MYTLFGLVLTISFHLFSLRFLVRCARRTASAEHGGFEAVVLESYGTIAETTTAWLNMTFYLLAQIAYIDLMGDIFVNLLSWVSPNALSSSHASVISKFIVTGAALPLCYVRDLSSLQYASILVVVSVIILVFVVVYRALTSGAYVASHETATLKLWPENFSDAMYTIPLLSSALICHANVMPLHAVLDRPTRGRVTGVLTSTYAVVGIMYAAIAVLGYLYALDGTCQSIFSNFAIDDTLANVGRIGIFVALFLSFPMLLMAVIDSFFCALPSALCMSKMNNDHDEPLLETVLDEHQRELGVESERALDAAIGDLSGDYAGEGEVSLFKLNVLKTAFVLASTGLAIAVPGVAVVLALAGATVCPIVCFCIPSACYLRIYRDKRLSANGFIAAFIFVVSALSVIVCTYATIQNFGAPSCPAK